MNKAITTMAQKTTPVFRRMMSSAEPDVIFKTTKNAGIITLNRPKVMNTFTIEMKYKIMKKLFEWEKNKSMVIIEGAGGKVFCAGGNLKTACDKIEGPKLFRITYQVDQLIYHLKIPYIALIDGLTMGGGVGLSVHGRYRVATESTLVAMPEVKVGLHPDAGTSYIFSRMEGNLGRFLGLTGARLKGNDTVKVGLATHFVPSKLIPELKSNLIQCTSDNEINFLLLKYNEAPKNTVFSLADNLKHINYCFGASSIEAIIDRLENLRNEWSKETLKTLNQMCPASLKITFQSLQRAAYLDLDQCLQMEYRISHLATSSHDFAEGVRALLVDKDNAPRWNPRTLAEVTDEYVDSFFKKLPEEKELKFLKAPSDAIDCRLYC